MTIKDLKDRRDTLWAELDKIVSSETAVRSEIKAINQRLFVMEATPQIAVLEAKISAGEFEGEELERKTEKLGVLKAQVEHNKRALGIE